MSALRLKSFASVAIDGVAILARVEINKETKIELRSHKIGKCAKERLARVQLHAGEHPQQLCDARQGSACNIAVGVEQVHVLVHTHRRDMQPHFVHAGEHVDAGVPTSAEVQVDHKPTSAQLGSRIAGAFGDKGEAHRHVTLSNIAHVLGTIHLASNAQAQPPWGAEPDEEGGGRFLELLQAAHNQPHQLCRGCEATVHVELMQGFHPRLRAHRRLVDQLQTQLILAALKHQAHQLGASHSAARV
eukprot:CAMPEP_0181177560 /NCGR_PEP_ID=MMETSP1096-20121128/5233_1 /TAXON_ID=156174 ORGANISM="Chrysochromulina ericina, Strain CCMP281" /NCGR_SAMPLE_ID=MMETSP1096 /ASSEMBLY_ACC=CAM_ASM_000453 /LENGTH=244 /DNA_ID=CAMNT_0023265733 /DNA_START=482 /DNA_END=1217 /DNA_ORIENTATION=+